MGWKVTLFWKARTEAVYLIVFNFEVQSELKYTVTAALKSKQRSERDTQTEESSHLFSYFRSDLSIMDSFLARSPFSAG